MIEHVQTILFPRHPNEPRQVFDMLRILLATALLAFALSWLIPRFTGIYVETEDENAARKIAQEQLLPYCKKEALDCSNLMLKHMVSDWNGWFVMYIEHNLRDGIYFYVPQEGQLEITPFGRFKKAEK